MDFLTSHLQANPSSATIKPITEQAIEQDLLQLTLNQRQLCDLELILNGGFAPLHGFMDQSNYQRVLKEMRLADRKLWPIPIILDVDPQFADSLTLNQKIVLRDEEGLLLAFFQVTDLWEPNQMEEAELVFGTQDPSHPGVFYLNQYTKPVYVGGEVKKIALPHHYDFSHLRHTPQELKLQFKQNNWKNIVGFQTRNPMHRAHQELTLQAAKEKNANILIHPSVGLTKPGDIEYYIRVRCYEQIIKTYEDGKAFLSLLPLAMRMGGPKEALWHAIIRKNYGCTHFIVGRDHAGPDKNKNNQAFYDPYAAQDLTMKYQEEIGIEIIPFQEMVYSHKKKRYFPINNFPKDEEPASISGTEFRERLHKNLDIPEWFSYQNVIQELQKAYPPKHKQGFTLFLTGLPSSGKSTIANALLLKLRELSERQITILDGDIIRTHLSKGLGFSREDRETNITRVGFVAKEITKHGGIAICALVAPYKNAREKVRQLISEVGGFIEVYVSTPLSTCETRDRKSLYKKAREGLLKQFTGISDPYEAPETPEIEIDTSKHTPNKIIDQLIDNIKSLGYIRT